jgi:hypothetical protein
MVKYVRAPPALSSEVDSHGGHLVTMQKLKGPTARERALQALRDHPEGLSKSELRKIIGGNAGAFRRLIQSMIDKKEIAVFEEDRPTCGPTKVHKIAA